MTEDQLIKQLAEVEQAWQHAKKRLAAAKKLLTDSETQIIELSIEKDRLIEALRVHRNTTIIQPVSLRQLEIERFRKDYPEVCALVKDRDEAK